MKWLWVAIFLTLTLGLGVSVALLVKAKVTFLTPMLFGYCLHGHVSRKPWR